MVEFHLSLGQHTVPRHLKIENICAQSTVGECCLDQPYTVGFHLWAVECVYITLLLTSLQSISTFFEEEEEVP